MKPACELQQLSAGYGTALIFQNLNLSVAAGESVALLGPNGAGKSTLLRVLTGLLPPSSGTVRLFGQNLNKLRAAERARLVAVVPQELKTPMAYSVAELVLMGRAALLKPWQQPSAADRQVAQRAMAHTDVHELGDRPLDALSGGEKQRAIIAMALAQQPRLIVMDEPTTHLDLNHSLEIMQIVERLNREQGVTVLMTSHDLNLAAEFCQRLVLLDQGRVAADGPPAAVLQKDILREVYRCDLHVQQDNQTGGLFVAPSRRLPQSAGDTNARVHLIAGGGSGAELLRRLSLSGYRLSCGVLNQLDSDAQTAAALGAEQALEKPFSPIAPAALAEAQRLAAAAAAVIVCQVPFGPGNLVNLDIAASALRSGKIVLINDRDLAGRDYTADQAASARIKIMLQNGARPWSQVHEALASLAAALMPQGRPSQPGLG